MPRSLPRSLSRRPSRSLSPSLSRSRTVRGPSARRRGPGEPIDPRLAPGWRRPAPAPRAARASLLVGALAAAGCWLGLAPGCAYPSIEDEALPIGPRDAFVTEVQPVLDERCASAGCHGLEARPLALYSAGMFRADPEMLHMDEPLTDAELYANALSVAAFALEEAQGECVLLCKPLSMRHGGCYHGGGEIFADRTDPGYRVIEAWLEQGRAEAGGGW